MVSISVCMIVKNEEHRLARCLDSLKHIADEIVIVDTGSMDDTKQLAAQYTDKIYDFPWINDFAAARNFAFSKCSCDYIYSADADEALDEVNMQKLANLKQIMLPEIDIVQMYYLNMMEKNTAYNFKRELRPKIFKRLRNFTWIDPIHETVRLEPVIYDSEIEIQHFAAGDHSRRDLAALLRTYDSGKHFSKKLHSMYAKELFIAGIDQDFVDAKHVFEETLVSSNRTDDEKQEASCVLARCYRIEKNVNEFFKICLKDMAMEPCAEICIELGEYFYSLEDFDEAAIWFTNAARETESVVYVRSSGDLPLLRLADCYRMIASKIRLEKPEQARQYEKEAEKLTLEANQWEIPGEL